MRRLSQGSAMGARLNKRLQVFGEGEKLVLGRSFDCLNSLPDSGFACGRSDEPGTLPGIDHVVGIQPDFQQRNAAVVEYVASAQVFLAKLSMTSGAQYVVGHLWFLGGQGQQLGSRQAIDCSHACIAPHHGNPSALIIARSVACSSHLPVVSRWGCQLRMNEKNVQKSVSVLGKPEGWFFSVVHSSHWLSTADLAASRRDRADSLRMA